MKSKVCEYIKSNESIVVCADNYVVGLLLWLFIPCFDLIFLRFYLCFLINYDLRWKKVNVRTLDDATLVCLLFFPVACSFIFFRSLFRLCAIFLHSTDLVFIFSI